MPRTLVRPSAGAVQDALRSTLLGALGEAPDLIRVADEEQTTVFVSDASVDLVGYRPDELLDRPVGVLDHPDDGPSTAYVLVEARRSRRPLRHLHRLVHVDGRARWVETTARSVTADGRELMVLISRDASALQELAQPGRLTRQRLATVVGAVPCAVALIDDRGTILAVTDEWSALMEHPGAVVGSPLEAVSRWCFGAAAAQRLVQTVTRTIHRQTRETALLRTSSSRSRIWATCTPVTTPLVGGVEEVVLVLHRDDAVQAPADDDAVHRVRLLTPRERDVLTSLAEGSGVRGVAQRLGIRESTVRGHIKSVMHKLEVHTQLQAVLVGVRAGLVPLAGEAAAT